MFSASMSFHISKIVNGVAPVHTKVHALYLCMLWPCFSESDITVLGKLRNWFCTDRSRLA